MRIGIIQETLGEGVETGVISSIKDAASHLEQLGSVVEEVCYSSLTLKSTLFLVSHWVVEKLKYLCCSTSQVSLPSFSLGLPAYYILASSEASSNLSRYDGIRYGRQVSGDDLNELYGGSRANGLGHEVVHQLPPTSISYYWNLSWLT
jgi:aspartyl-tRNA(Asn)/glutamyl-tRNA(Gln) amidotransferase subunit A